MKTLVRYLGLAALAGLLCSGCAPASKACKCDRCEKAKADDGKGAAPKAGGAKTMGLSDEDIRVVLQELVTKLGSPARSSVVSGVNQVAALWRPEDGDAEAFAAFCRGHFLTGKDREALFERWQQKAELVAGHFEALSMQLRLEMDEDRGPLLPMDMLFAGWNPGAHLLDDLFSTKLAFMALLNFPVYTLEQMITHQYDWGRRAWAEARLAQSVSVRVPADVVQDLTTAYTAAENYIANYNICMDQVLGPDGKPMFRAGLKLISHWGLRDELKAQYADPKNLPKQEMIQTIMERIVRQEIPAQVVDNCQVQWDPKANTVAGKPAAREEDARFQRLLDVFHAQQRMDLHTPRTPSHVDRRFKLEREMLESEVEGLLVAVLEAPASGDVAALIGQRLGRKLQPFDIWYDGFKARGSMDERELDKIVAERYPTVEAFQKAIPDILGKLGFDEQTARFLGDHIEVDPARGAGHAAGPRMRTEKARLRTKVPQGGMNYKGFNIAMHELGHNVEQVFSLYRVDHTLLEGVPNTAFTEGFAFVFQARDLDVLGLAKTDPQQEALDVLDDFWMTREIAGVGIVDMRVWRWMYAHPEASPAQLREAVVQIAKEVWNTYYAPILGVKDSPILAIYSHMIAYGLYLPDYPMGHIIAFQVEDYFKSHPLAKEMERMCAQGRLTPNAWMKGAVGAEISAQPLVDAAARAVAALSAGR